MRPGIYVKLDEIGREEFKRLYFDEEYTTKLLCYSLGIDKKTMGKWAKLLDLPYPRSKAVKPNYNIPVAVSICHKCRYDSLEWCKANPYAFKLPCEKEGTPAATWFREDVNLYPSHLNFWNEDATIRSMD